SGRRLRWLRSGSCCGGGFRPRLLLLARYGALGVVACLALADTGSVEETQHAVGRLRALRQPMLHALEVEIHALLRVLRQHRIIGAEFFDEAAVARITRVGDDHAILRALLGAHTGETDLKGHAYS